MNRTRLFSRDPSVGRRLAEMQQALQLPGHESVLSPSFEEELENSLRLEANSGNEFYKLKVLIDVNASGRQILEPLKEKGFDVVCVSEIGMGRASDEEIFNHARKCNRIIITQDRDFINIGRSDLSRSPGIVVFPQPPTENNALVSAALEHFLSNFEQTVCAWIFKAVHYRICGEVCIYSLHPRRDRDDKQRHDWKILRYFPQP